jgi:3-dehydroquinate synthase
MKNDYIFSNNFIDLKKHISHYHTDKIFVLCDENTFIHCLPKIIDIFDKEPITIQIPAGEDNKSIDTAIFIWNFLTNHNADRKSLLINLGGGMITDLGGFVASTYKRGIDFINIPTTLLAQVDASIGGKNGINLNNYKNIVGLFNPPKLVYINADFLSTLPSQQLRSGFAEVIKHALIDNENTWKKIKTINPENIDLEYLQIIIKESVAIKMKIVNNDPHEKGLREALNFGHTIGHAIETFFNRKKINILHGEAIAIGMIAELFLSNKKFTFDFHKLFEIAEYIATYYPAFKIEYNNYDEIYDIMKHDKKNKNNQIRFSLLKDIGQIQTNQTVDKEDIIQALNFYFQIKR